MQQFTGDLRIKVSVGSIGRRLYRMPNGSDADRSGGESRLADPAPMPFPRRRAIGLGVWLLVTVLGVEVWYWVHETGETLH
jgi:hypothetical protein